MSWKSPTHNNQQISLYTPYNLGRIEKHQSQTCYQNSYVTQKLRNIMKHVKVRNLELFGQIINHVTLLISEQLSES